MSSLPTWCVVSPRRHLPPRYLKPNPFDGTQTFCVVRDPLDRMLSEFKMDADDASHVNRSDRATRYILQRFNHRQLNATAAASAATAPSSSDARTTSPSDARAPPPPRLGHASAAVPFLYTMKRAQDCHLLPASLWVWGADGARAPRTCAFVLRFEVRPRGVVMRRARILRRPWSREARTRRVCADRLPVTITRGVEPPPTAFIKKCGARLSRVQRVV